MAFDENLTQFFDSTNGFAVSGTFKNAAGATIRTASVIFTDATGALQMFDAQSIAAIPFVQCRTADLASVDNTCKLVIGAITYRIVDHYDDGTGTSVVQLRK